MYQQPHMPQPGMMPPQQGMPNQMQFRKRPSEADPITKHIKKKRPTDRNMPAKIEAFVPECKLYSELTEFEKKLDGTIMRKRLDIQEALGKPTKIRTTLRVFVSNTSSNQQQGMNEDGTFDMNSGNAPSWTLKIDGKLLDKPPTQAGHRFTSFFRAIGVELDRDPKLYPEGNVIEWHKQPNAPEHDGIEITRRGDANVNARIILDPEYIPQRFKISPALSETVDMAVGNKPDIVMALWTYIKQHKLQDADDKRLIHCDARLKQLFNNSDKVHFSQIPELINQHLSRPDPVVINYTIRVDKEQHQSPQAYDIDVEIESPVRQKMMNCLAAGQTQKEIMGLDEKIVQCVQSINNSKIKRDFLLQFSQEPVDFINKWIASQARDLEVILGESKINLEEMRRNDFYKQPWIKEAVFHYLTAKVQQRMQDLINVQRGAPPPPQ
ncbi:hypothetical protein O0I10_004023 [Lichtheimia ornata]|uniref:DM2 domain-containing protein n=1 Tax=Lichtheimia ornata TaxID=688661 RepID=A0AAD7V728_9FUNG|nr:uncharacterized protein O0I10_004023 [Lichtheimia ornata]KAJ8660164.1 hypothetical protein O0I10_004023 [Lichtheimia ornata]